MTEDKLQKIADDITSAVMTHLYGDRFSTTDDITTDDELSDEWDSLNELIYDTLDKEL